MPASRLQAWWPIAAIGIVALTLRLVYLNQLDGSPLLAVLMGDARVYDEWAMRIARGDWIGTGVFYQTPLYPYVLGIVFRLAGHDPGIIRIIQAALGSAACVLLAVAGSRFFDRRAGIIAGFLLAVYPPAIFFDGLIQKSSLDLFLVTGILALLAEFQARRAWPWLISAAAANGALVLNRENAFVLFPVIAVWLFVAFGDVPVRRRGLWAAGFAAAALAVLLPVGIRNYRAGGEFVLSTAQLGPNFYIGNNPKASGSYESLLPGRGDAVYEREDATALASKAAGRTLSPGEVSRYWLGRSFEYIRTQPLDWLRLSGRKLLLAVNAAEISDTESLEAYAESSPLLQGLSWIDFGIALPLAVFGAWISRREWRRLLLLHGIGLGMLLAVAAFFVVARYRHPVVPIVLLFAGAGIAGLSRPARREWIPAAVMAIAVAAVAHIPMKVVHDQTYVNLGGYLARNDRPADALPFLQKAVALDPDDYHARMYYGMVLCRFERTADCVTQFQAAERIDPASVDAPLYAARAQAQGGDFQSALVSLEKALRIANANGQADRAAELTEIIRQTKLAISSR